VRQRRGVAATIGGVGVLSGAVNSGSRLVDSSQMRFQAIGEDI
jgi:hypothetical protein